MIFQSKKYWITVGAFWVPCLALAVLGYLLTLEPQARRYKNVHEAFIVSNDRVSVARLASFEDTRNRQQALLENLRGTISEFIVPADQKDRILFEISRLASTLELADYAGKNQQDLWNVEEGEQVKIHRLWMTINFKSSFRQFAEFLNSMERNLPAVFVESAGIESVREQPGRHRAKLLIAFFTRPDTKSAAAAEPDKTTTRESLS